VKSYVDVKPLDAEEIAAMTEWHKPQSSREEEWLQCRHCGGTKPCAISRLLATIQVASDDGAKRMREKAVDRMKTLGATFRHEIAALPLPSEAAFRALKGDDPS
jgi:hypothetical protein